MKQILPSCPQVNKNLEGEQEFGMFGLTALSSGLPILVQRISVGGPGQLRMSGTRLGLYGLKRLIYCRNITMRSTVGRNSVEILLKRC